MYLQVTYQAETTGTPIERGPARGGALRAASRGAATVRLRRTTRARSRELNIYYGPALMWDQLAPRSATTSSGRWSRRGRLSTQDGGVDREEYLPWVEEQTGAELSEFFDGWLFAERSPKFPRSRWVR